jgi:hypothetical protein
MSAFGSKADIVTPRFEREEWEELMFHRKTKLCAAIVVAAIMLTGALSLSYAETGSV